MPKLTGLRNLNLGTGQAGQDASLPAGLNTKDVAGVSLFLDERFTPSDFAIKPNGQAAEKNVFETEISESRKGSHAEDVIQTLSELSNTTNVGNTNTEHNSNNINHVEDGSSVAMVAPALPHPGGVSNTSALKRHAGDGKVGQHTQPHKFRKVEGATGGHHGSRNTPCRDDGVALSVQPGAAEGTQPHTNNGMERGTGTGTGTGAGTRAKKTAGKSKRPLSAVKPSSLSAEDAASRRRELNRLAAQKCRKKRDDEIEKLEKVLMDEEKTNSQLKDSVALLSQEIIRIRRELEKHAGCMPDR